MSDRRCFGVMRLCSVAALCFAASCGSSVGGVGGIGSPLLRPTLCPHGGYDDGYEFGTKYAAFGLAVGGENDPSNLPTPGLDLLDLRDELRGIYRVPAGLSCPDYDFEFSAGMQDGLLASVSASDDQNSNSDEP